MSTSVDTELKNLRIDRSRKSAPRDGKRGRRLWLVLLLIVLGAAGFAWSVLNTALEVETVRVRAVQTGGGVSEGAVVLNATGYIIAAHKIQLASKVVGKVLWIGIEKGDRVKQGQVLVRLEDDEYRAQLMQAKGNLAALEARLAELQNGSRPEEIARAKSDVETSRADLDNARVNLDRIRRLVQEGVFAKQQLDDAQARYDAQAARTASLQRTADLAVLGPRQEQIASVRGQIEQARGQLALAQTQFENTLIKAPISGTILERNVERGEFVTTGFVGDRGAKGYVASLADLNDLQVELDISQNDFAKLDPGYKAVVTTDAYPDRKYDGVIDEISPEANRQKATVPVKVKILAPDEYLRPQMNSSVAFVAKEQKPQAAASKPLVFVPPGAIKDGAVFIVANGRAAKRTVRTGPASTQGVRVEDGLIGGEDVVINPPAKLKDGDRVKTRESR